MRIGIIGTGTVGATLGKRWAATGHEVMFGAREPGSAKVTSLVAAAGVKTRAGSVAEAARFGEVVVLATPFDGHGGRRCSSAATTPRRRRRQASS